MKPIITIIMPTYNGAKWIKTAIDSVLTQSFREYEFIIINDCSKDNTEDIVLGYKDPRIKYFKNEKNMGVQKTRNIALSKVQGEYVSEIDQDDEWVDLNKLQKQISFLKNNNDYVLVGTGAIMVNEKGDELGRYLMPDTDEKIKSKMLRANPFIHSSVMFRAKDVKALGGYAVGKMSEDHDLWLRLGRLGKLWNFQEYSVKYLYSTGGYNSQDKIKRLMQNIQFAEEHKRYYPGYFKALVFGWGKVLFYPIFNLMPTNLKGVFLKLHKKM
jgi:glycosyltransferase involved in cell wall biosynthesis